MQLAKELKNISKNIVYFIIVFFIQLCYNENTTKEHCKVRSYNKN